ncbi:MAG: efflux RND transporter permease subunit [Ignavibacteriae bacterium]|nr:efflux RND transporter permease subunit [Ignavibacteriota bacterium]
MKSFKPTNWSIENKIPVYILAISIIIMGFVSYVNLPKEQFPDIVIPTIVVQTIYPGTTPSDIEMLITRQIEKQLKSVTGIKRVTSQSLPDVSVIIVEFATNVTPAVAKQRVTDAVDKSKSDLPNDLQKEPMIQEIEFSEFPIMFVNIVGDMEPYRLKTYADDLQEKIEAFKEITRVDIIGAPEREFQVNVDLFKMTASGLSFSDIERAISAENVNFSTGEIVLGGIRRDLRLKSEFKNTDDIKNIVVKTAKGNPVYIRDVADVRDDFKEQQNFARLNGKPVITLSVIKRSGENLIEASEKINTLVQEYEKTKMPQGAKIIVTGDRSVSTKTNLDDLVNSVIIGFILVVLVLMFFLGVRDSIFVGLSVPLSSFLAFLLMPMLGFSFNVVVTFTFLLALGIVVDDAIVVIENTHRLYTKEHLEIRNAAKTSAGEVFIPVLTGTLTTLAPFIPLLFFPGIVGKFMYFLPVIMIITLLASLFVAFIINPVLAAEYMHVDRTLYRNPKNIHKISIVIFVFGILFHLLKFHAIGNLLFLFVILGYLNKYIVTPILIKGFQERLFPYIIGLYKSTLRFALRGKNPYYIIYGMIGMFIFTMILFGMFPPKVNFFPEAEPNFVYVYVKLPIGTDARVTDSVTKIVENKVYNLIGHNNPIVKSVIANVGIGAGDPNNPDRAVIPYKGKITIAFVDFAKRGGKSTQKYLDEIRTNIKNLPGTEILVEKENNGPPTGKPINIEISGDKLDELINIEGLVRQRISDADIAGIEKLNSDIQQNKPEILLTVNRSRANNEGLSSGQIGMALRTAIFGKEASKFRDDKDEYSIQIRLDPKYRNDLNSLLNMPISFRDMATGSFRQIPISAVADVSYIYSFESIKRKNQKRTIILSSNVLTGYNAIQINSQIEKITASLPLPKGYEIKLTGQQEDQQEAGNFIVTSFFVSIALILLILVTQFNSTIKPFIIITQVLLSTIGVFLGFILFRFTVSVVMTGIGIVALAGIVVKNGIILIDFIELLRQKKGRIRDIIIQGGSIRFNPVILTASATTLGVVPLAFGFNINFATLLSEFRPQIFIGGDSASFWGPLAWAIIFGLTFATFLTLVVVPCMYFIQYRYMVGRARKKELKVFYLRKKLLENQNS